MNHADTDLDAFRLYCTDTLGVHEKDDPCLLPYLHALAVIEEYQEFLCRVSEVQG
jgi:hypothetical protein